MTEEANLDVKPSPFFKKNWRIILLVVILAFAFYLRYYHADYPVIGYHNWKETHYLTEGRNFAREGFFAHGFFVPSWDYPDLTEDPSGEHSDSFPTTSILLGILFKLFGDSLLVARLLSISFALATILLFYLFVKELFKREDLAFVSVIVLAINPLNIFFGRQVELLGPGLFFSLLGVYYYVKWLKIQSWKNTILFSFSIALGVLTRYNFVVFPMVMAFMFPYKRFFLDLKEKKNYGQYGFVLLMVLLAVSWLVYISTITRTVAEEFNDVVRLSVFIDPAFWNIMWLFVKDNFTAIGFIFSILGIIFYLFLVNSKKDEVGYKFFKYYIYSAIIWFVFMGYKIQGHNYHQYPIMLLIVFMIAFFFLAISAKISKMLFKTSKFKLAFVVIFLIILYPPTVDSKNRMFDTQFAGLDIAGEYIKEHKQPTDRVIHSSHQAYGLLWHGDIKGTGGIPVEIEDIKFAEDNLNSNWIFVYQWDFSIFSEERFNYIKDNYRLAQIGMVASSDNQLSPVYFLFKKGGSYDPDKLDQMLNEKIQNNEMQEKDYELSGGKYKFYYIDLE